MTSKNPRLPIHCMRLVSFLFISFLSSCGPITEKLKLAKGPSKSKPELRQSAPEQETAPGDSNQTTVPQTGSPDSSPPAAGQTTTTPANPASSTTPALTLVLQATLLQKVVENFDQGSFLSWRNSGTIWNFATTANGMTQAIDASTGAPIAQTISPCAALPSLQKEPDARLLPAGIKQCWSIDETRVNIVRHHEAPQASPSSAFYLSNIGWQALGRTFTKEQFASYTPLSLTEKRIFLASSRELLVLSVENGSFGLLALDLSPLKLDRTPDGASIRWDEKKRVIALMLGAAYHQATETGEDTQLFQWAKYQLKVTTGANSGLTEPELEQVTKVARNVMEDGEEGSITSHYFVQAGPHLYGLSVGAVPAPLPPTPQEWGGLAYLKTYCKTCHSAPQGASGGLRLLGDNDAPLLEILKSKRAAIIERINLSKPDARAMPPYAPLPSDGEKRTFQDALNGL